MEQKETVSCPAYYCAPNNVTPLRLRAEDARPSGPMAEVLWPMFPLETCSVFFLEISGHLYPLTSSLVNMGWPLRKWKHMNETFRVSLGYIASLRPA